MSEYKNIFSGIGHMLSHQQSTKWAIKNYLPLNSTVMLYGEPGSGKTFLALDMALNIATGQQKWHCNKVRHGAVFYIASESHDKISCRLNAWSIANAADLSEAHFYYSNDTVLLPDDKNEEQLISCIDKLIEETNLSPSLICFDALSKSFSGDENSAKDIGEFLRAIERIQKKYECCILIVHDSGKDKSRGGRGSSALRSAIDVELYLNADEKIKKLEVTKAKNIVEPDPIPLDLTQIQTNWKDDDLEVITSAVFIRAVDDRKNRKQWKTDRVATY